MVIVKSINWRMSEDEWAELQRVASHMDRTPLDSIRKLVRDAARVPVTIPPPPFGGQGVLS